MRAKSGTAESREHVINLYTRDEKLVSAVKAVADSFSCRLKTYEKPRDVGQVIEAVKADEFLLFEKRSFTPKLEAKVVETEKRFGNRVFVVGRMAPSYGAHVIYLTKSMVPLFLSLQIDRRQEELKYRRSIESQSGELEALRAQLGGLEENVDFLKNKTFFLDKQRIRLGVVLERQNRVASLSHELNCLDFEEIVNVCIHKVPRLVNAKFASFYIYVYEKDELHLIRCNPDRELKKVISVNEDSDSLLIRAIQDNKVTLIRDIDEYEKEQKTKVNRKYRDKYETASCIIAPIRSANRLIGVLSLSDKMDGTHFDELHDLPPIEQLIDIVGASIRNYQLYQEVKERARVDGMTNFLNHNSFFEELEKEILKAQRYGNIFSLIMIDIDNFKLINDIHGHLAGDHVLRKVAGIIRENIRGLDIPARYGGDEFALIVTYADIDAAVAIAERIRKAAAQKPVAYAKKQLAVTLSMGLMQYRTELSLTQFIKKVDDALYRAKFMGRNRSVIIR
jgi:diguanylate cyclase (GGDEF)-like protein